MVDTEYTEAVARIINGAALQVWGTRFQVESSEGKGSALLLSLGHSLEVRVSNGDGEARWSHGTELCIEMQLIEVGVPTGYLRDECMLVGLNQLHSVLSTFSRWSITAAEDSD